MIKLRTAQFADYTAIAILHAENWRQNYRGIFSDRFLDHEVEKDRSDNWYQRLQSPAANQFITVAMLEDRIVGFSGLYLNEHPAFGSYLDNLHVAADQQRSGIGKLLLQNCAHLICDTANTRTMYLWVFDQNINARKAYEHLGAIHFETVEQQFTDGSRALACRYTWNDIGVIL